MVEKEFGDRYKLVVNDNVDMSEKIDEGTLVEIVESTGFCFVSNDDDDRPYLVYRDEEDANRDSDGSHAIGYLTVIQGMD